MTDVHVRTDIEPPPRIRANCKQDSKGRYVPWFVYWPTPEEPDFRVIAPGKIAQAVTFERCWMCGEQRGRYATFVIGPMCAVNRNSAEPPCHRECAIYAALVCPFLTHPKMRRNEKDLPETAGEHNVAGVMIRRNPGVTLCWTTRAFKVWQPEQHQGCGGSGILFDIGDAHELLFFAEGRKATREEILASIDSGMPILRGEAEKERDPAVALAELERMYQSALTLVPAA